MKKLLYIMVVLGVLAVFILSAVPVFAIANPDTPPTLERINVYRNLVATGDMCMIWEANIPYATTPAFKVSDAFTWRMIALDGVTILGTTTGFAYHDDGYGYNVYSMYWSPADIAALGIVWGTAYTLRLSGNPVVFTIPPSYNYTVAGYTTHTTSSDNKTALSDNIILIANDLNTHWGLTVTTYLTTEADTGTVLSIYGEAVFRGSIYGVQAMAPGAFSYVIADIDVTDRTWGSNYTTNLSNQYSGTWIATARNASAHFFGTSYDLLSLVLLFIACLALVFCNLAVTSDHWNGLIDVAFVLVIASRMDVLPLIYLSLLAAVAFIYLGTRIWRMIPV
jgi:hypothetical protein